AGRAHLPPAGDQGGMQLKLIVEYEGTRYQGWQVQPGGPTVQKVLERALATVLREPVRVRGAGRTDAGVHACGQVAAVKVTNAPAPSPFWRRHAWYVPEPLDAGAMDEAAAALVGEHDFAAFRGADAEPVRSTVRRVLESRVHAGPVLVYRIEATAFLKHMVRNIVGTLVEVGRGERAADSLRELLASRDRMRAGATAPAHGLILVAIRY